VWSSLMIRGSTVSVRQHSLPVTEWRMNEFQYPFQKSVWSTRIGRITPMWNPGVTQRISCRCEILELVRGFHSVVTTLSPHNIAMLQGHRYFEP
jgi:hypothetical protein